MSDSKITLFSFAKYMDDAGDDLFSLMTLPSDIDKQTLTDNILLRGGEFEVVYSDPFFLQKAISIWSSKWYRTFDKWITALNIDYNPLENYDRIESFKDVTDKDSGNTRTLNNEDKRTLNNEDKTTLNNEDKRTLNNEDKTTLNNKDKRTYDNEDKRTLDTTNAAETIVSAYDSSTYQPSNKVTTDDDGTITDKHTGTVTDDHTGTVTDDHTGTVTDNHTGTVTDNHTGTVTDNHTGTITDKYADDTTITHYGRTHGNIGVTTSQQMLESELDIARWNIYEHITDIFLSEFIIPIYD